MSFNIQIDKESQVFLDVILEVEERLGMPVIEHNLDNAHIIRAIEDAIRKFADNSHRGTFKRYIMINSTEEINVNGLNINTLMEDNTIEQYGGICEITDAFASDSLYQNNFWNLARYQSDYNKNLYNFSNNYYKTDIAIFNMYNADSFKKLNFIVNKQTGDIKIQHDLKQTKVFILEVFFYYNSDDILENQWVKEYATALAKIKWGNITSKYRNLVLSGGVEINASSLISEGRYDREQLLEELRQDANPLECFFY